MQGTEDGDGFSGYEEGDEDARCSGRCNYIEEVGGLAHTKNCGSGAHRCQQAFNKELQCLERDSGPVCCRCSPACIHFRLLSFSLSHPVPERDMERE
jgi:hypothetical protein